MKTKLSFALFLFLMPLLIWATPRGKSLSANAHVLSEATQTTYTLTLSINPEGAGYIYYVIPDVVNSSTNESIQLKVEAGKSVKLQGNFYAGINQCEFLAWTQGTDTLSKEHEFTFTMPAHNTEIVLQGLYDPENPQDPNESYLFRGIAVPEESGSIKYDNQYLIAGKHYQITANRNGDFKFKYWTRPGSDSIIATTPELDYVMPAKPDTLYAHFEFDPVSPDNPNPNHWDKETGYLIIDDFKPGMLLRSYSTGCPLEQIQHLVVYGECTPADFGGGYSYQLVNCRIMDYSRTTGLKEIYYVYNRPLLEKVYLPADLEDIKAGTFLDCPKLTHITCYALNPPKTYWKAEDVFAENLTVEVPPAAVEQYQADAGWSRFNIRPIQEEMAALLINLPDKVSQYENCHIELQNAKNAQCVRQLLTGKNAYRFTDLIPQTVWNLKIKNDRGDVFASMDTIKLEKSLETVTLQDKDLDQTFDLTLRVRNEEAKDINDLVKVTWYDKEGHYLAEGSTLENVPQSRYKDYSYSISLNEEMAQTYAEPKQPVQVDQAYPVYRFIPIPKITVKMDYGIQNSADGEWLNGVMVSALQEIKGNQRTIDSQFQEMGKTLTFELPRRATKIRFYANDFFMKEIEAVTDSMLETEENWFRMPLVKLSPIKGARINLTLPTGLFSVAMDELEFKLHNVTRKTDVKSFKIQGNQLIILDETSPGEQLTLNVHSVKNRFSDVTSSFTFDESMKSDVEVKPIPYGDFILQYTFNGTYRHYMGLLFDQDGNRYGALHHNDLYVNPKDKSDDYISITGSLNLVPDGNYTLALVESDNKFLAINRLSDFDLFRMEKDKHYLLKPVKMVSGQNTVARFEYVKALDHSGLNIGNGTLTSDRANCFQGNYMTLHWKCAIEPEFQNRLSNLHLVVQLEDSCQLVEGSVMKNKKTCEYTTLLKENQFKLALDSAQQEVVFCMVPLARGKFKTQAYLEYTLDGKTSRYPCGLNEIETFSYRIYASPMAQSSLVRVHGRLPKQATIRIFDDDVCIYEGVTPKSGDGNWSQEVNLNRSQFMNIHHLNAFVTLANGIEFQVEGTDVTVDKYSPYVKTITMSYFNTELRHLEKIVFNPYANTTNPAFYLMFQPGDFTYVVRFNDNSPKTIQTATVHVKTIHGQYKELEAEYSDSLDRWVAVGEFAQQNAPVNAWVEFYYNDRGHVDADKMADNRTWVEEYAKGFTDDSKRIDDFFRTHPHPTPEQLAQLEKDLGISLEAGEPTESVFPDDFDGWTEDKKNAFYEKLLKDNDTKLAEIEAVITPYEESLSFAKQGDFHLENGSTYILKTCSEQNLTAPRLRELGYQETSVSDGSLIFEKRSGNTLYYADLGQDIYVEISTAELESIVQMVRMVNGPVPLETFDGTFLEAQGYISKALTQIQNIFGDFSDHILQYEKKITNDLNLSEIFFKQSVKEHTDLIAKGAPQHLIDKASRQVVRANKAVYRAKNVMKYAMPVLKKVVAFLPIVDIYASIRNCQTDINRLQNMYDAVLPCMEDQENAVDCMARCEVLCERIAYMTVADIAANVASFIEIATGVAGAAVSGGTSMLVACWGAFQKYGAAFLSLGFDFYKAWEMNSIKNAIRDLKCKKDWKLDDDDLDKKRAPGSPDVKAIMDPSGYVYEAVASNRLEGVTATCFHKEETTDEYGDVHEKVVKWNAEDFAQQNPLLTDKNGKYAWNVPQGMWQVKFEKKGYETAHSEWLPVPPPQLEVNVGMKQNTLPCVTNAKAYEKAVEVTFDKYMLPESLTPENIRVTANGQQVEGTINLLEAEKDIDGNGETYARKVRFDAAAPFTAKEVTLHVTDRVKSYAGLRMGNNFSQSFPVEKEIRKIECDSLTQMLCGEAQTLVVKAVPAEAGAGRTLNIEKFADYIVNVDVNQVKLDANGVALIQVKAGIPGTTALNFSIDGTNAKGSSLIQVKVENILTVATPVASLSSGMVEKGTEVTLTCDTENATIYYTLDGTCPCNAPKDLKIYDGTPIVIDHDLTLKVMGSVPGMYQSETAEYNYTIGKPEGIEEVESTEAVTVDPMPMRKTVRISADGKNIEEISIQDLSGATVLTSARHGKSVTLSVENLPAGVYLIQVFTEDGTFSRKVLKVN